MTRVLRSLALLAAGLVLGYGLAPVSHRPVVVGNPVCSVRFSPHGGCTDVIVDTLRRAQTSVLVQAYSFTSEPITQALVAAHERGVKVAVILDKSQRSERHSTAERLVQHGVPVSIDDAHAIAHNKVIIVDGETVLTGSFNFTEAAEAKNAENLLEVDDRELAAQYERNWRAHLAHSKPYRPTHAGL